MREIRCDHGCLYILLYLDFFRIRYIYTFSIQNSLMINIKINYLLQSILTCIVMYVTGNDPHNILIR